MRRRLRTGRRHAARPAAEPSPAPMRPSPVGLIPPYGVARCLAEHAVPRPRIVAAPAQLKLDFPDRLGREALVRNDPIAKTEILQAFLLLFYRPAAGDGRPGAARPGRSATPARRGGGSHTARRARRAAGPDRTPPRQKPPSAHGTASAIDRTLRIRRGRFEIRRRMIPEPCIRPIATF